MSTQNPSTQNIPFTHTHPQQNLRLLELPPTLLELLSSPNPPTLHLKSFPLASQALSSVSSPGGTINDPHVRLCTSTQTYLVRQVSSSNSVFVIKPTFASSLAQNADGADEVSMELDGSVEDTTMNGSRLTAIALCPSTLELHLQEPSLRQAVGYLKEALPVYDVDDGKVEKRKVYDDMPLSMVEIDAAWSCLCAFDIEGSAWRPAASTLIQGWNMVTIALQERKGTSWADLRVADLMSSMGIEEKIHEVVSDLDDDDGKSEWLTSTEPWAHCMRNEIWAGLDVHRVLSHGKGVKWVGALVLEDATTKEEFRRHVKTGWLSVDEFLEKWRDAMPERWRDDVTGLDALDRSVYEVTNTGLVRWVDAAAAGQAGGIAGLGGGDAGAEKSGGKGGVGRKWHEKFKAGRK